MNISHPRGFTLVELLVALTVGLLITLVVTQAYLSGLGTQRAQTSLARAQEASRFAFDALSKAIRRAGYKNPKATGLGFCDSSPVVRLVAGNDMSSVNPTASNLAGSTVTVLNTSDVVRVRYFGEGNTVTNTADGTISDCQGTAVAPNALVEETYFVAADANNSNEPTLFCYSSASAGNGNVALIPGVESLQMLYGEDTDSDGSINRYVTATNITNANNVRSIMISVVTRTPDANAVDRSAQSVNHFGSNYPATGDTGNTFNAPADGRMRQHSVTTIALRNICPV